MSDEFNPLDEQELPHDEAAFAGPNLSEEVRLGAACRSLIDSEAYKRATAALQDTIWVAFRSTPVRDVEGLSYLRLMVKVLQDMHILLEDTAVTGKMAAQQLTEMQEASKDTPVSSDEG